MKKGQIYMLFCFSIICLYGCQKPYPQNILHAEELMITHPDSALVILNSQEKQIEQEPKSTQMYYNLLLIEAYEKCDVTYPHDSLIPAITRYYEEKADKDKLMKSYYFMGKMHLEIQTKDDPSACVFFFKALNASAESKDYAFIAKIHFQLSQPLMLLSLSPKPAIEELKTACHYFQLGKDNLGKANALQSLAQIYDSQNQADSALYYYQKAYELANKFNGKRTLITSLEGLAKTYIQIGNTHKALEILNTMTGQQKYEEYINYNILGDFFLKTAQQDSATYYFKKATRNDKLEEKRYAYRKLYQLEKERHNYEQGLYYFEKQTKYSDSIYTSANIRSLQRVKALYDSHLIEQEKDTLSKENMEQRAWIIGIMLTLAIMSGLFIQYYRTKKAEIKEQKERLQKVYKEQYLKSRQHIEDNKKKIQKLENMISSIQQENGDLQQELLLVRKEKLEQANQTIEISQKEQVLLEETLRKSEIYAYCYHSTKDPSITLNDTDWEKLTDAINTAYDNFTDRLFVLYPSITTIELHICLLLKIGIPTSTISQLVYRTHSAISMSRKQLYKKIFKKEGSSALLDEFIISF